MFRMQFLATLTLGCAFLIAGCALPAPPPSPSSTTSVEPVDPDPSHEPAKQVTIDLTGPIPTATHDNDIAISGSLVTGGILTADLDPDQSLVLLFVGLGPVTTTAQLDDSSPMLVSGQFEFGLGPPRAVNDSGDNTLLDLDIAKDGSNLTYTLALPAGSLPVSVAIPVGSQAATGAVWTSAEGGKSLQVSPSDWGRSGGMAVVEFGWASVLTFAPDADSNSMRNQFQCHAIGAPAKTSWNLEPWRPDVGLLQFMAQRCNP